MGWKNDIAEWAHKHQQEPSVMEKIAIKKGWDASKYKPSMKSELFDFLTKWYTLSVKTLPEPATSKLRKNPTPDNIEKYTKLSNGWRIWTLENGQLFTTIASNGQKYKEFTDNDLNTAFKLHDSFVDILRKNNG